MKSRIVSTGMYVPPRIVTNKDLEKMMDTTDDWIVQRSGIRERRWVGPGDTTCGMAAKASRQAIEKAGLKVDDIDAIVFGCLVSDYIFPGSGVLLQRELGFKKAIPALDIRNQCTGFLYGMSIADAWIRAGNYKRILVVGSEIHSTSMNVSTEGRDISVLFGDGAGAMILEAVDAKSNHIIETLLFSEGLHAESLAMVKPSANDIPRIRPDVAPGNSIFPQMDGKMVFKNAVTRMTEVLNEILDKNKIKATDLDFVVAHQANARINQMVMEQMGVPPSKTHNTLDHYGNTTMATIPITFNEAHELGKIKRGQLIALVAFGAGFTWGATLLKF